MARVDEYAIAWARMECQRRRAKANVWSRGSGWPSLLVQPTASMAARERSSVRRELTRLRAKLRTTEVGVSRLVEQATASEQAKAAAAAEAQAAAAEAKSWRPSLAGQEL